MGEAKRQRPAQLPPGDIMRAVTVLMFQAPFTAAGIPIRVAAP